MNKLIITIFASIAISNIACAQSRVANKVFPMDKTNPNFSKCGQDIYEESNIFFHFYLATSVTSVFLIKCPTNLIEEDVLIYRIKAQGARFESEDGLLNCYSKAVAEDMKNGVKKIILRQKDFCTNPDVMDEVVRWMRFADKRYNPRR